MCRPRIPREIKAPGDIIARDETVCINVTEEDVCDAFTALDELVGAPSSKALTVPPSSPRIRRGLDADGNIPDAFAEMWWYEETFGKIHEEVGAYGRGVKRVFDMSDALRDDGEEREEEEDKGEGGGESINVLRLRGNLNTQRRLSCAALACGVDPPGADLSTVHQTMHPSVTGIPSCPGLFLGNRGEEVEEEEGEESLVIGDLDDEDFARVDEDFVPLNDDEDKFCCDPCPPLVLDVIATLPAPPLSPTVLVSSIGTFSSFASGE